LVIPNDKEDTLLHITHYGVLLFVFAKIKTNEKAATFSIQNIAKPTLLEMQFQSLYDRIENCHCRFVFDSFLFKKSSMQRMKTEN
jgi:hypothetical protein